MQAACASVPRSLYGTSSAVAQRRIAELRARQRAEALAARKDELRRRREVAARLVEVGLGSQLRFAGAVDALGLEGDEEDATGGEGLSEGSGEEETPPMTIG